MCMPVFNSNDEGSIILVSVADKLSVLRMIGPVRVVVCVLTRPLVSAVRVAELEHSCSIGQDIGVDERVSVTAYQSVEIIFNMDSHDVVCLVPFSCVLPNEICRFIPPITTGDSVSWSSRQSIACMAHITTPD